MNGNMKVNGISRSDSAFLEALVNSVPAGAGGARKKMTQDNVEDILDGIDNLELSMHYDRAAVPMSAVPAIEKFISENCPYFTLDSAPGSRFYVIHNVNIGRLPHNDIQVSDNSVSRLHCRVFSSAGKYYCVDMTPQNNDNKAVLDGYPVNNAYPKTPAELFAHMLQDGSRLTVGKVTLVFHMKTPVDRSYTEEIVNCESSVTAK